MSVLQSQLTSRQPDAAQRREPANLHQRDSLFGSSSSTLSNESVPSTDWTHSPEQYRGGPRPAPPTIPRRYESLESEPSSRSSRNSVQARAIRFDNHEEVIAPVSSRHLLQALTQAEEHTHSKVVFNLNPRRQALRQPDSSRLAVASGERTRCRIRSPQAAHCRFPA